MLTTKFKALLPPHIQALIAKDYMTETMGRMRRGEVAMTREDIRVMATETEVLVATMAPSDKMANVFITPPTPRAHLPTYQPYPAQGRPPAPQPTQRAPPPPQVCFNCYTTGHKKAACPYASTAQAGGQPAREGGDAKGPRGQPAIRPAAPPRQA